LHLFVCGKAARLWLAEIVKACYTLTQPLATLKQPIRTPYG
jgi:hypothetical protein